VLRPRCEWITRSRKLQFEARVPAHAQNDDLSVEVPSLEQIFDRDKPLHLFIIARHPRVCTRALNFPAIMDLSPDLAPRADCSNACENARSGVRCRETPGDVPAHICQQVVVPHAERILDAVAVGGTSHRRPSSCPHTAQPAQGKRRRGGHRGRGGPSRSKSRHVPAVETRLCTHSGSTTRLA